MCTLCDISPYKTLPEWEWSRLGDEEKILCEAGYIGTTFNLTSVGQEALDVILVKKFKTELLDMAKKELAQKKKTK